MQVVSGVELEYLHKAVIADIGQDCEQTTLTLNKFQSVLEAARITKKHLYWNHLYYYRIRYLHSQHKITEALEVAHEAVAGDPTYAAVWQFKGILEQHLGLMADAISSFKKAWRLDNTIKAAISQTVSVLVARRRYAIATKLGRSGLGAGISDATFLIRVAQAELGARNADLAITLVDAFEAAVGPTDHSKYLRRMAESLRAHQIRHIAITGMSYVGSTLFGTLLGSLPGCAHAGETQELIHRFNPKSNEFPVIDFEQDPPDAIPQCRICGPTCTAFNREFRAALAGDPVDWYFRIGRRLGARTIISSDKFLSEYMRKDPLSRFDLIILYKPLASWVYSYLREEARKAANGQSRPKGVDDIVNVLNQWAHNYLGFLKDLRPQGRRLVINWDRFSEKPGEHFDMIVKRLDLPGDSSIFDHVHAKHYVGGNDGVGPVLKAGRVEFRASRAGMLTPEDHAIVDGHYAAQMTFRMLETYYRRDFSGIAEIAK